MCYSVLPRVLFEKTTMFSRVSIDPTDSVLIPKLKYHERLTLRRFQAAHFMSASEQKRGLM